MRIIYLMSIIALLFFGGCEMNKQKLSVKIFETSAGGNKLTQITSNSDIENTSLIKLFPEKKFQTIIGFGGAFTESSAYLLYKLSEQKRLELIKAYFGNEGANYTLTRTHINSCDFSLKNYSYAPVDNDKELVNFSIDEDRNDIIPMIKLAQQISNKGFKIMSSPWTAPPWMKDNKSWKGGKLLAEYYETWALYFSKYIEEYKKEGIDIWAVTVENEPLGNGENWESMHFSPEEMVKFTNQYLGPKLKADRHDVKIFGYDQNRDELKEWAEVMFHNEESSKYFDGTAIHWYASTVDWMPEALQFTHKIAPDKHIIQTEACVDAEVPHWQDDDWYWKKEATDWGWDWAPEEDKKHHPKYVPVYRYARDIIGCLNNHVEGWIDWNMILDRQGGPNWANNWCIAPVIVDPEKDEIYYTPLYYTMAHFSKFIRPDAKRIEFENSDNELMITAAQNPDSSVAVVVLNMTKKIKNFSIQLKEKTQNISINPQAIQSILINSSER